MRGVVCFIIGAAICAAHASTSGAVVASDSFSYPDGPLSGRGPIIDAWTTAWTNIGLDVVSGVAVTNTFANPPKYCARGMNDPAATNELFVKFTFTAPPAFVTADYFALDLSVGVNNPVLFVGKGVSHNNFTMTGVADTGIPVTPGQTYSIVAAITYAHDAVPASQLLWINPDASDFYDPVTGASSADAVGHAFSPWRAGTVTLYASLAGVKFDDIVFCDTVGGAIPTCAGDVNGDGLTNISDFNILAGNFGAGPGATRAQGDLSGDGFVNISDFNILAGDFGCL